MKNLFLFIVLITLISSCDKKSKSAFEVQEDSLLAILAENQSLKKLMNETTSLLDSIELAREKRANLSGKNNTTERLKDLHLYVKSMEKKIKKVKRDLRVARNEADAYLMLTDALKGEVEIRDNEVHALADSLLVYKNTLEANAITSEIIEQTPAAFSETNQGISPSLSEPLQYLLTKQE
jgi:hypothetical protein